MGCSNLWKKDVANGIGDSWRENVVSVTNDDDDLRLKRRGTYPGGAQFSGSKVRAAARYKEAAGKHTGPRQIFSYSIRDCYFALRLFSRGRYQRVLGFIRNENFASPREQ